LVNGLNGSMGKAIQQLLKPQPSIKVQDFKESEVDLSLPNVVIDFSSPNCIPDLLKTCVDKKLPLIIGTTGLNSEHYALIDQAQKIIPILLASNMSAGIAKLKHSIKNFLHTSEGPFSCKITEIHHTKKIDSPSGTAIEIKEFLEDSSGGNIANQIEIHSSRLGRIFGIHRIEFYNAKEAILFQHVAGSRDIFANGAIHASQIIGSCPPGIYNFSDFLTKKL